MADDPGKPFRDKVQAAADKAMEVYDRNKRYKPNRGADKYILERAFENIPGMRPSASEDEHYPYGHQLLPTPKGRTMSPLETAVFKEPAYTDKSEPGYVLGDGGYYTTKLDRLKGLESMEKDLEVFRNDYNKDRKAWDEAVERLRSAGKRLQAGGYTIPEYISAADKKTIDDLRGEVAQDMTAPGAQENRAGRIQEVVEAMDLTNPESASRAGLRQLGRLMIDDQVPRVAAGYKTQTGEEFMLGKLKELGVSDTPTARGSILSKLGMQKLPDTMPLLDASGNRVILYQDEIQAAGDAAREKAYLNRRRDPMRDTPERD